MGRPQSRHHKDRTGHLPHYDFAAQAQALAKVERGHARDVSDLDAMLVRGLISATAVRAMFAEMEPELYRFPAIDPPSYRRAVDAAFPPYAQPADSRPPSQAATYSHDGRRFLGIMSVNRMGAPEELIVVENFIAEVRAKVKR